MRKSSYYKLSKREYKDLHNYAYQIYHHWEEMQEAQIMLHNLMQKIRQKNIKNTVVD